MNERWPHQVRGVHDTIRAVNGGAKRVCITAPTGAGKTRMMIDLLEWAVKENRWQAALYTFRTMLLDQTRDVLRAHNIDPGMRAAGYETAYLRPVQLCMTQTEGSQVLAREARELHAAQLVIVDEPHAQKGETMKRILNQHAEQGAAILGFSATPVELADMFDELIVAGNVTDCRACGALVKAITFAPDEPDLRSIKRYAVGMDLSEGDNVKAMMRPGIFGRVLDHYNRLNPDRLPAILFAPGVAESKWFAEEFVKAGIRAASLDGEHIWIDGEQHPSTREGRDEIRRLSESGELPVVCNRFVLREGVDWPHLRHGIFATVFGALTSYLQSGGRLLRAHPGKSQVIIQDHGGGWWRHGSLNADREWHLSDTNAKLVGERAEKMREKKDGEKEPICCPNCGAVRAKGPRCTSCGHESEKSSRMVVMVDGNLRSREGDVFKPRQCSLKSDTEKKWTSMYYRAKNSKKGMTFGQCKALFFRENGYWPPQDLPMMPREKADWSRKVSDVSWGELIQPERQPKQQDPQTSMFGG